MGVKAVVFDLDGTLLDTVLDVGGAVSYAMEQFGYERPCVEQYSTIINNGIIKGFHLLAGPDKIEELQASYVEYYHNNCTIQTRPFDGVEKTLSKLRELNLRLGVLTNKTQMTARKIIEHYLPQFDFDFIWGRDGIHKMKPDLEGAERICQFWKMNPSEIAFVGDSPETDIPFAKNAGFMAIASIWGYYSVDEILKAEPDFAACSFSRIAEIIE